ncbi:MAG: hypothetical protein ACT4P1_00270 [Sporichthyaceae bacterium]
MGRMPPEVMERELDMMWQDIFTYASYAIAIAMLVWAFQLGMKHRTAFFVLISLGVFISAFAEPLYDVAFDLWFYDVENGQSGAMYSHFSAFGVVQPIWSHSGYLILYAGPCLYAGWKMYQGQVTRNFLLAIWGIEIATSCVFEMIGTGVDVYTYYGPFEMRLWNYPLVVGFLEGTQVILFTVLAVNVWRKIQRGWGMASLLYTHPITMFGVNFGIGAPVIIALHLDGDDFSSGIVLAAELLVIGLCAMAVFGAAKFLPTAPPEQAAPGSAKPERVAVPA